MYGYNLSQEWIDHLAQQPESGMGYQICDIYFTDKTLTDIPVTNSEIFFHDDDSLNLEDIVDIIVNPDSNPFSKGY